MRFHCRFLFLLCDIGDQWRRSCPSRPCKERTKKLLKNFSVSFGAMSHGQRVSSARSQNEKRLKRICICGRLIIVSHIFFLVQFQTAIFPLNKKEEQEMGEGIIFYLFRLFRRRRKKKWTEDIAEREFHLVRLRVSKFL